MLYDMKLSSDYLADAIENFEPNGLHFEVSLSCQGEVWEELHTQIVTHLAMFNVILPPPPPSVSVGTLRFHHLPWVLLHPGNRTPDGRYSLKRHATVTGVDFDLQHLRPIVHKMGNPRQSGQMMLNLGMSPHWSIDNHPFLKLSIRSTLWSCEEQSPSY